MGIARIIGVMLVVAGAVLLSSAYQAKDSFAEKMSEQLTGTYSERTKRDFAIGAACVAGGGLLLAFGGGRRRR